MNAAHAGTGTRVDQVTGEETEPAAPRRPPGTGGRDDQAAGADQPDRASLVSGTVGLSWAAPDTTCAWLDQKRCVPGTWFATLCNVRRDRVEAPATVGTSGEDW